MLFLREYLQFAQIVASRMNATHHMIAAKQARRTIK